MKKKFIIPLIASGAFIVGLICLMVPFLPFGWFLMFVTALLLTPYFKPVEKLLKWLIKKDKTGLFNKARQRVARLYHWAGDYERAKQMSDFEVLNDEEKTSSQVDHQPNPGKTAPSAQPETGSDSDGDTNANAITPAASASDSDTPGAAELK